MYYKISKYKVNKVCSQYKCTYVAETNEVEGWRLKVEGWRVGVVEIVKMVVIEDWGILELSRVKVHLLLVNYIRRIDSSLQRITLCQ